ncbi:MAG TPA: NAD(P)H-binding protein, partial [Actinomycetota bacterium]|nr:NAD(P)H-binding protein [Actinomycetota bacterium]
MAILVTGAAGLVGRAAVAALLRQEVEHVRAVVREPGQVAGLRRLGAKVALLEATDPDSLAAAMDGVFTACSLTGGLWPRPGEDPYAAVVEPARVFLAAAAAVGVRRVVVCSPAALATAAAPDPPGHPLANPHLAAKAEVERLVAASGLEHAILRCAHVLGPGGRLLELLAGPP